MMMYAERLSGIFYIIPATVFLTISFFVMSVMRRTADKGLKTFGKVVSVLLWVVAGLILCTGIYIMIVGYHPLMKCGMHEKMMSSETDEGMQGESSQPQVPSQEVQHR